MNTTNSPPLQSTIHSHLSEPHPLYIPLNTLHITPHISAPHTFSPPISMYISQLQHSTHHTAHSQTPLFLNDVCSSVGAPPPNTPGNCWSKQYRRTGFNCIVKLLHLSLFSYIVNLGLHKFHIGVG